MQMDRGNYPPSLSVKDGAILLYSILVLLVASVLLDNVYSDMFFCLHMII
jgi:hypothetical protein